MLLRFFFCVGSYCLWLYVVCRVVFFFFKQKTAYEMRISDWSSDVCSSDLAYPLGTAKQLAHLERLFRLGPREVGGGVLCPGGHRPDIGGVEKRPPARRDRKIAGGIERRWPLRDQRRCDRTGHPAADERPARDHAASRSDREIGRASGRERGGERGKSR